MSREAKPRGLDVLPKSKSPEFFRSEALLRLEAKMPREFASNASRLLEVEL